MFSDVMIDAGVVRLRNFRIQNAEAMYFVFSNDSVLQFLPPSDRGSFEQYVACLNWQISCYESNTSETIEKFVLAIELKSDSRPIGCCGLGPWDPDETKVELFYMLHPEFWNRGITTTAASALLSYGLDVIGLPEIVAGVNPANFASERILQKIGLHYRGVLVSLPKDVEWYNGENWYSTIQPGEDVSNGWLSRMKV